LNVDGSEALNGVPISALIEAREQADAGVRIALAQLAEQIDKGAPALEKTEKRRRQTLVDDDPAIDLEARERALTWITELHEKIAGAELLLATLGGFMGQRSLGAAAVNSTAIKLGEAREQLPVLRQAVRDMEQGS
jgi:hypothetical protein